LLVETIAIIIFFKLFIAIRKFLETILILTKSVTGLCHHLIYSLPLPSL
jgi:hypothetical protein